MIKKFLLAAVVVLMIASVMPATSVFAAPVGDDPNPDRGKDVYPRLEKAFQRVQNWYEKQGEFLAKADDYISKADTFIGKAEQRGLDTSALRSLLESFESSLPLVQAAHDRAGAIISAHNGFDANGKVTDPGSCSDRKRCSFSPSGRKTGSFRERPKPWPRRLERFGRTINLRDHLQRMIPFYRHQMNNP